MTIISPRPHPSLLVALLLAFIAPGYAQEPERPREASQLALERQASLRFTFERTPWRDVIEWLAGEANMALHVDELPTGSLTYRDPSPYSLEKAIDRINLFLLPQKYTVVRSGRLLSVVNLNNPRSAEQLGALAELISLPELSKRNSHDVVKCIFPLAEVKAEDAATELGALNLMTTPVVFAKTNRLMIIDTAGKLRSVKLILDAIEPAQLDNGTVMKTFTLQHLDAEDLLLVARPHLGLATGEMIGIDVSISSDVAGKNLFVTGVPDKVKLVETLVESLDKPKKELAEGQAILRSHPVAGGNVDTVYNVLLTLLAGKSVRLAMDKTAGSIVALASPETQAEIEKTVAQLQASDAEFEVIQLKNVDPYFAISLLEQMLTEEEPVSEPQPVYWGRDRDDRDSRRYAPRPPSETSSAKPPRIDADPGAMRLYVRGTKKQIEQIKRIVAKLDSDQSPAQDGPIRVLPYFGRRGVEQLEIAVRFWRAENPIILLPAQRSPERTSTDRVLNGESNAKTQQAQNRDDDAQHREPRYLTENIRSQAPPIHCQQTPRGLLLQSEDIEALNRLEAYLKSIAGATAPPESPPVVFYLKYARPQDAIRILAELLDGRVNAAEAETGTLVKGYVAGGGSLYGSLVTSREGAATLTFGTLTVVADTRLNRLIAQGSAQDMQLLEDYLKIVDKQSSITSVEIYGASRVIALQYSKATMVAAAIREAYSGRILNGPATRANAGAAAARNQQPQRSRADSQQDRETQSQNERRERNNDAPATPGRPANTSQQNQEPKMTLAVHEPSNSLIVTAPDQLFKEVEALAKTIDARNERAVSVLPLNVGGLESLQQALQSQGSPPSGSPSRPAATTPSPPRTPQPSPAAQPRRQTD